MSKKRNLTPIACAKDVSNLFSFETKSLEREKILNFFDWQKFGEGKICNRFRILSDKKVPIRLYYFGSGSWIVLRIYFLNFDCSFRKNFRENKIRPYRFNSCFEYCTPHRSLRLQYVCTTTIKSPNFASPELVCNATQWGGVGARVSNCTFHLAKTREEKRKDATNGD